jgi:hypothetical protein
MIDKSLGPVLIGGLQGGGRKASGVGRHRGR